MSASYLLPCTCGQPTQVEMRQAGESVSCPSCGTRLEVPTLRQLRELQPAPAAAGTSPPAWGRRQGLIFLGLVIAAVSAAMWGFFYHQYPTPPTFEVPKDRLDALTLVQTFDLWNYFRHGMPQERIPEIEIYNYARSVVERRVHWSQVGLVVGLILAACGFLVPSTGKQTTRP